MNAVAQKIKADLASRPLLSILIVVTVAAAAALLTLALATLMNLEAPYDKSFQELDGAHLWLYFNRDKIRPRDVERIEALPGVTRSTGLQYSFSGRARIRDARVWTKVWLTPSEPPAVNRLLVQAGRGLAPGQAEVLASRDLSDLYGLSVGDVISLTRPNGKPVGLPVIGLAYNPIWDTYRSSQPPYLYVSEETMRKLFPDETAWEWSMGVRLADPNSVSETLAQIEAVLRPGAVASHTDWRDVKRAAVFGARLNFIFLGAFSFFAILAAILVVASSVGSIVLSQFRQIGILKAVGFTPYQVVALYVGQYLLLSLVGAPVGVGLGMLLSPLPLKSVAASLSTTFQPPFNALIIVLVLGIVSGVVVLATLGSAYRGARANIVKAIVTGAEAPRRKPFWGVRLASRLGLPVILVLGLNDVFARPFRSLLTGINLTLGVIGIVFGLALNETLDTYRADPTLLGVVYDAVVTREMSTDNHAQRVLSRAPGVEAFYGQSVLNVETLAGLSFQVKAVQGDLAAFPFRVSKGRFFRPGAYEAIAGQGLLDWLGLAVGDEITLIVEDKRDRPTTWRIVGQYPESSNTGQMLMVSLPTVARLIPETQPRAYYLKLDPQADTALLRQYLMPRPDADLSLTLVEQAIPGVVVYLQLAIFGLAGILIGIALVNVFNTSLLAVQERRRAVGVLKTLGMTPAQVVAMVNTSAGLLGLTAAGLGMPLSLAFTRGLLTSLAAAYGFGEVQVSLSWPVLVALLPLMVGVSMAGSLIPARQAARVPIVSVLRDE